MQAFCINIGAESIETFSNNEYNIPNFDTLGGNMEREKLIATVTAAQNGDSDALNKLFNTFYNDVYYFALKTVQDEDIACDVTQETFVEIINTIGKLQEPAAFVKWMKQITYHQCTRYFKKKKDILVDEDEEGNTIFDTLKEDKTEFIPDEALDQQDFRDTILAMLDELSEEQRSATMLYYYDELSVKQIAEIQNVSEGTVKSRLNYARKSIKNSVETYEKKNGVKLHCAGVLPLLLWLLSQTGKETMPAAAANTVAGGVTATTGVAVSVAATASGAAVATATVATTAASGVGIAAKIAALPVIAKVIAGVVAGSLVIGGIGMAVLPEKEPGHLTGATMSSITDTVYYVPDGCTYTKADGTVLSAGQAMPETPTACDAFTVDCYTYRYNAKKTYDIDYENFSYIAVWEEDDIGGWILEVTDDSRTSYPALEAQINGEPVVSLRFAFFNCTAMEYSPELPDSVTNLSGTFSRCSSLIEAPEIPTGATDLSDTFKNCTTLVRAPALPGGLINLSSTFFGCSSLVTAPAIPEGVTDLSGTFAGCSALVDAPVIPASVTDMSSAFSGCSSLIHAPIIPEGVTDLGYTFSGCSSLVQAPAIPDSVTDMTSTFSSCSALVHVPKLPDRLVELSWAFKDCTSLLRIPAISVGVTDLSYTFSGCSSLVQAPVIPNSVMDMSHTFENCSSLTDAPAIPNSVTDLSSTFAGCSALVSAPTLSDSVTDLSWTFYGCTSLEVAPEIPNGVTDMSATFSDCTSLTAAPVIPESVTDMTLTFSGCSSLAGTVEINAKLPMYVLCGDDCFICSEGILCWNCYSCTAYGSCFYGTQGITLTGTCPELYDIALRAGGSNITVDSPCAMPLPGVYGTIPAGCNYVTKSGITYTAGQAFPKKPSDGDQFITPDYTYCYGDSAINGVKRPDGSVTFFVWNSWCVFVNDTTKTSYGGIYESVNGYYVTGMLGTFAGCTNLIVPPAIPTHVTSIDGAFERCTSMTTAPMIPRRVEDMADAFRGCVALTGTITVHADDIEYSGETFSCKNCFYGTAQPITLTGSSTKLAELAATSNNGNVTVQRSE